MDDKFGGPAFPITIQNHGSESVTGFTGEEVKPGTFSTYSGMNLRDYFAAKCAAAMVSTISDEDDYGRAVSIASGQGLNVSQWISRESYKQADAMLAERAK